MAAVRSPAMTVGGHIVRNPADAIADYLERHGGTVTHYDFLAGTFDQINHELIRATRSPWMGSRISMKEAAWLIDRGTTAPWAAIPVDARLRDADPLAIDGLYDRAAVLWEHFWAARPGGVSTAKISKTLYWEAVRRDIVANEAALHVLRRVLPVTGAPLAEQAAERLTDLRLLDMLAFAAGQ